MRDEENRNKKEARQARYRERYPESGREQRRIRWFQYLFVLGVENRIIGRAARGENFSSRGIDSALLEEEYSALLIYLNMGGAHTDSDTIWFWWQIDAKRIDPKVS